MTTTQIRNRETLVVTVQQLSAGTTKHMANGATASFLGATFTEAQITSKLQSLVTLKTDVDDARAAAQAKVAAEKANAPPLLAFMNAYVAYVKAVYGTQPDVLADFGIRAKARVQPSVATKTAAVAKRESTRAARHTMGARQKQAVKGDVTGVTVTPVHAAPTSAAPAAPAPNGQMPATRAPQA